MSSAQPSRRATRRYTALTAFFVGIVAVSAACKLVPNHESVEFTFDNRTDSFLCYYLSSEGASAAQCRQELEPQAKTTFEPGCGDGQEADQIPLTVVLTVKEGGRQIYDRTEECRLWQRSDGLFVIEKPGDEFIVTDSLPNAEPSPEEVVSDTPSEICAHRIRYKNTGKRESPSLTRWLAAWGTRLRRW